MADVFVTETAERDLEAAIRYVMEILSNPKAASRLMDEYEQLLGKLERMPEAFPYVRDSFAAACGYRWGAFGNYMAFFTFDEALDRVVVERVLYKRRDWANLIV
ncbi:MAG: type II toxin-antitoxin system RelE/ParE family toxin [Coriobacteriia bacterium]|nr:type II toxin-antitoxin system RelE/ParE family toxin [Coriobacteriia bacterium]